MKSPSNLAIRLVVLAVALASLSVGAFAVTPVKHRKKAAVKTAAKTSPAKAASGASPKTVVRRTTVARAGAAASLARTPRRRAWVQTWDEPTYKDSTLGDLTEGEDPVVRQAAVEALGPFNGSVVVSDPTTGRFHLTV